METTPNPLEHNFFVEINKDDPEKERAMSSFWSVGPVSLSGGEGGEEGGDEPSPPLKRNSSALNVAKLLKKTISKHNLHAAASESPEAHKPKQYTELNGHAPVVHTNTSGHAHSGPEQNACSTDPDHQGEPVNQKHNRKKDSCSLATVTEETNGDGETDDRYGSRDQLAS